MTVIQSLNRIRIEALNHAPKCDTVYAMRLHTNIAALVSRVEHDLSTGKLRASARSGWTTIFIDPGFRTNPDAEGAVRFIDELTDLGIKIANPPKTQNLPRRLYAAA